MLSIRIDSENKFIDLFQNQEVSVSLSSPLFSEGVTAGSYCFNFNVPNSPNNASLLGFPARLSKFNIFDFKNIECSLFINFSFWKKCVLNIVDANHYSIEIVLGLDASAFIASEGSKLLPSLWKDESIFLGNTMSEISDSIVQNIDSYFPDNDFCYPTYLNPNATKDIKDSGLASKYNQHFKFVNYFRNNKFDNWAIPDMPYLAYNLLSPQMFNSSILAKIFSGNNLIDNLFFKDSELNKLICFSPFINNKFYFLTWFIDIFHSLIFNSELLPEKTVPNVKISEYLSALLSMFNAKLITEPDGTFSIKGASDIHNDPEIIMLNPGSLMNIKLDDFDENSNEYSFKMKQINDGFQNNFIKSIKDYNIKGYVNAPLNLPSSGNEYGDAYLVLSTNRWFVYTYDSISDSLKFVLYSYNFPYDFERSQYWEGLKPFEYPSFSFQTNAGTILHDYWVSDNLFSPSRSMKVPQIDTGARIGSMYETFENKWSDIAFLFYRGVVPSTNPSYPYPYASFDNELNGAIIGNYSLAWDGEYGLFEKFHRPVFDVIKNGTSFKCNLNIPKHQLLKLDISKKYQSGDVVFYFKKIDFTISGSNIINVSAECLRI